MGAPARVGRYEVLAHVATGGMAQIYLARIAGAGAFERHVVLKTILPERASDHRFVTMFLDEAKLAATLNHQNIAQVYDVDQADGAYFMAMEYVHGENVRAMLETTIKRGIVIPFELAIHIVAGAAAGLHHAHERKGRTGQPLNIVHRDVSPANIMVGFDGSVKVLDFGIAKAEERATRTVGNTIKGKYGYMSPEQCKGMPLDRRSDIFALGIVLYELTTQRRAFKGQDDFDTMKRIVGGEITRPSKLVPGYPMELEAIVMTALANRTDQRFQTANEMLEALDTYAQRAKITGGANAMSRFMQLVFGARPEPWVTDGKTPSAIDSARVGRAATAQPTTTDEKTSLVTDSRLNMPSNAAYGAGTLSELANQDADSWATYDSTTAQRHENRARPQARAGAAPARPTPTPGGIPLPVPNSSGAPQLQSSSAIPQMPHRRPSSEKVVAPGQHGQPGSGSYQPPPIPQRSSGNLGSGPVNTRAGSPASGPIRSPGTTSSPAIPPPPLPGGAGNRAGSPTASSVNNVALRTPLPSASPMAPQSSGGSVPHVIPTPAPIPGPPRPPTPTGPTALEARARNRSNVTLWVAITVILAIAIGAVIAIVST